MLMTALSVRLPQLVTPHQQTSWCQTLLCSDPCYWLPASLSEPLLWVTCSESQCSDLSPVCVSSRRWGASSSQRGSERIDSVWQRWLHCSRTGRGEEGEWNASVYLHTPERGARAGPGRVGPGWWKHSCSHLLIVGWFVLFLLLHFDFILQVEVGGLFLILCAVRQQQRLQKQSAVNHLLNQSAHRWVCKHWDWETERSVSVN